MKNFMQSLRFGVTLVMFLSTVLAGAQVSNSDTLATALSGKFTMTEVTSDNSEIVTPGTQVQFRLGGLWMYSIAAPSAPASEYKNGKIVMGAGAFGRNMFSLMRSSDGIMLPQHKFVEGDKCWITSIEVKKDGVWFHLYSDPVEGARYFANLKFDFPDKNQTPDAASMLALVSQVLAPVLAQQTSTQNPNTASQQAAVPAATVSYQDIPAPPPPPASAPTVALGMSREQVIDAIGPPTQKAIAGSKEILFYSDTKMKITLTDGSVTAID